ncbi:MAG: hypothetical protein KAT00_01430 [Planctomycetes bacterium]|nr:hypothetical protein [Planctomycetota bacterium]
MDKLDELVEKLAKRRLALALFQDDAERLMEHCKTVKAECDALAIEIGKVAMTTGKEHPHPAVEVIRGWTPRVEIASDLNKYLLT